MIHPRLLPLLALTAALTGCYSYMNEHHHRDTESSARADRIPPARVTGAAVSCVPLTAFGESRVQDDRTIDFLAPAGRGGWRNSLPSRCPGLGSERAFSFNTSLSQLCSTDIIHVIRHDGPRLSEGAGCGLGPFVPIELTAR